MPFLLSSDNSNILPPVTQTITSPELDSADMFFDSQQSLSGKNIII